MLLLTLLVGGCARDESLYGQISQLTPSVCVAAERATGQCFMEGNGTELFRDYRVGDCVRLTYHEKQEGRQPETGYVVVTEVTPAACKEGWRVPPWPSSAPAQPGEGPTIGSSP